MGRLGGQPITEVGWGTHRSIAQGNVTWGLNLWPKECPGPSIHRVPGFTFCLHLSPTLLESGCPSHLKFDPQAAGANLNPLFFGSPSESTCPPELARDGVGVEEVSLSVELLRTGQMVTPLT